MVKDKKIVTRFGVVTALIAVAAVIGIACGGGGETATEDRLDTITDRGRLICGVQSGTPGFGTPERVGHDADYCRAIAAGIFGTVDTGTGGNLEFVSATGDNRFELLAQGDIDVLVRTTTWTSGRDSNLGAAFTATTFYDNAGIMVNPTIAAQISSATDLNDITICARSGTSTLDAIEDFATENGITIFTETSDSNSQLVAQYTSGACDAFASDQSQLAGIRSELPGDLVNSVILSDAQLGGIELAKEPLGPSTHASGGFEWFDYVQWVNFGLIAAEEEGITQSNVAEFAARSDLTPNQQRILGTSDNGFAFASKLENGQMFMQDVLSAVGNYGEVYERNLGSDGIGLVRACTAQALWNPPESSWLDCDGNGTITQHENRGLMYAPRYSG